MKGLVGFARRSLGLQLHPGQVDVLKAWELSGKRKAMLVLGRRSGKGILSAIAVVYNAVVPDYSDYIRPGETRFILAVATNLTQARDFIAQVRSLLDGAIDPDLVGLIDTAATNADEITLRTEAGPVCISAMPCSSRAIRGRAASMIVGDEAAHMQTTEDGYQAGRSVWRALAPSIAQFGPKGYALITSTPLWPSGWFPDMFRAGESGADPDLFVIRRPTWEVRDGEGIPHSQPITRESLEGEFAADPEGASVEYGAEFSESVGSYLDAESVRDCVIPNRQHLPRLEGVKYVGAADPAFAQGGDQFAFAIGHLEGRGDKARVIIDRLESWRGVTSALNSDIPLDQIAELAREYDLEQVISDQYAATMIADGLRRRGVVLKQQPLDNKLKGDIFQSMKRLVNMARLELPDRPDLVTELLSLQLKQTKGGLPKIEAVRGARDDLAMVVATVTHALAGKQKSSMTPSPPLMSQRSPWLGEGQEDDQVELATGSRSYANAMAPPPAGSVPEGAPCQFIDSGGRACHGTSYKDDGRCLVCDHPHPSVVSTGRGTPYPVLLFKSNAR